VNTLPPAPSARSSPSARADWLELLALTVADRNSSLQDLIQEFRRSGSGADADIELQLEGLEDPDEIPDRAGERSFDQAEEAFGEVSDRATAAGPGYPFQVLERSVEAKPMADESLYTFLLLVSSFGLDAVPGRSGISTLFERVCMNVAAAYLGGASAGVLQLHIGAPRFEEPTGFKSALQRACEALDEGVAPRQDVPIHPTGDGGLDLLVWRPLSDGRVGKVIGFGQCATGRNWEEKTNDLIIDSFVGTYLTRTFPQPPFRMFFVPHRIDGTEWWKHAPRAGIIFDRCRLACFADSVDPLLTDQCRTWSASVLGDLRK